MRFLLIFFLSLSSFAREGMEFLNYFPAKDAFFKTDLKSQSAEIAIEELQGKTDNEVDTVVSLSLAYGHKIDTWSFWAAEIPFIYREENYLRYGVETEESYVFRGLREPELFYFYRFRNKSDQEGEYFSDLQLSLIPGFFPKAAGGSALGAWSGKSVFRSKVSTGALYDRYEAKVTGMYEYFSWGKGENDDTGVEYTNAPYYRLSAFLDLQQMSEDWMFFLSSGLSFTSDHDVKTDGAIATVQLGTASIGEVGAKYLFDDSFLKASYTYQRNDLFTKSRTEGNFRGDYVWHTLTFSYVAEL